MNTRQAYTIAYSTQRALLARRISPQQYLKVYNVLRYTGFIHVWKAAQNSMNQQIMARWF